MDEQRLRDSIHRLAERADRPEESLCKIVQRGRLRILRNATLSFLTVVALIGGATILVSDTPRSSDRVQSAGLPVPPDSLREELPDELGSWVRPGLVLAYRINEDYQLFFEGVVPHSCPIGTPLKNPEACFSTAQHVEWGRGGAGGLTVTGSHDLLLPEPPQNAEVLWRGAPEEGSLGADSPGACERAERFEGYYECRGDELVYVRESPEVENVNEVAEIEGRVAFLSERGKGFGFHVLVASGPDFEVVTKSSSWGSRVSWSPKGDQVVVDRGLSEGHGSLVIIDVATGEESVLLADQPSSSPGLNPQSPAWSPDGDSIAFNSGSGDIYVIDAQGGEPLLVARSPRTCGYSYPTWSPDSDEIAFSKDCPGGGIHVISVEGGEGRRITDERRDRQAAWSPDGKMLAFTRYGDDGGQIVVIDLDEDEESQLTEVADNYSPSWSPNGKQIVFGSNRTAHQNIWVMDADGSEELPVTIGRATAIAPAWAPE